MQNLEPFRGLAELNLKVYLSMDSKTYGFPKQNMCFRTDLGVARPDLAASKKKSKRFRLEV